MINSANRRVEVMGWLLVRVGATSRCELTSAGRRGCRRLGRPARDLRREGLLSAGRRRGRGCGRRGRGDRGVLVAVRLRALGGVGLRAGSPTLLPWALA